MAFAPSAQAALVFCNRTQVPIEAALAYRTLVEDDHEDWVSEGWWHIEPGQCSRVYGKSLEERFYFYYAMTLAPTARGREPTIWAGDKYKFCIDTKAFRIIGDGQCDERNYQTKGFQQIDLGSRVRDYTMDFKENR